MMKNNPAIYIKAVQLTGELPAHAFPGSYPIYYLTLTDEVRCAVCAAKEPEIIHAHDAYMEGIALTCLECNAEIISAYGDPNEEENQD